MFNLRPPSAHLLFVASLVLVIAIVLAFSSVGTNAQGQAQTLQVEYDGPDSIRERVRDYLRRHGIGIGTDPNNRLRLVREEYERMENEKAKRLQEGALPGTNWVSLGPTNAAGRMTALAVHPTIAGTVYVGAAGGGVWKTIDGGQTWAGLTDSINNLAVGALAIAPSSPNIIYLGTGEGNFSGDVIPGIGFLKSTDGGQTWQFPLSVIATNFCKISVHPTNPQEVVIGTSSGGFRSIDGGGSWTSVIPAVTTDFARDPSNPQILYSTTRFPTQILKSTDGGSTWSSKGSGVPVSSFDRLSIAISASSPLVLYTAGATQDTVAHIYKTTDGGESWVDLAGISTNHFFSSQSWYDNTIVVSPSNSNIVAAGGVIVVRSTDGGTTWTNGASGHVDAHDLQYQGSTLFMANDGGIWSSTDNAQTASSKNAGLVTRQYYTVANDPINRTRIFGGTQDNGTGRRPDSGGTVWTDIVGGDGFDCAVNPYQPEVFYATIQLGLVLRTKTAGATNSGFDIITPPYPSNEFAHFFTVFTMDPNNPSVLYTGSNRVWKSTNGGDSWAPLPTTTTDGSSWPSQAIFKIAVARSDTRVLMVSNGGSVFRSTDGGSSWVKASTGLPACNGIEIDSQNANIAYAPVPSAGHLYMTTNGGGTWTPRGSGLPSFPAHVVRVDPTDANSLFCGTDVGVYRSTDKGLNWSKFGTGIPSVSVYDLRILDDGSALRAATHGRGMWELQIPPSGNNPPAATISNPASDLTIVRGTTVNFQGTVSDPDNGDSATGTWFLSDLGDVVASGSGNSNVARVFNRVGVFAVSLTARDTHGALSNATRTISVSEAFDSCASPIVIPGDGPFPWSLSAKKDGATKEASDSQTPCVGNPISHTLWFEFTPTVSDTYKFSTKSSKFVEVASLWTGPRCGPHTVVANGCALEAVNQPATVFATAGVTLHIMVSSVFDDDAGSVALIVTNSTADPTLRIDSVNPPFGRASGGQQIKLAGDFVGLTSVTVGGVAASWNFTNGTSEIAVSTPQHGVGAVGIGLVRGSGGSYSRSNAFAYLPTVYTDNTLLVGVTPASAQHIIELRQAVDALRAVSGLGPALWTDPVLSPFIISVKAVHILELRLSLEDAVGRLGYAPASYTDSTVSGGFLIKRVHIEDLRQRIRGIAG